MDALTRLVKTVYKMPAPTPPRFADITSETLLTPNVPKSNPRYAFCKVFSCLG